MRSALLLDRGERTFVVVFDKDDEVVEELTRFATRERLRASHVTAIGALRDVVLGYFDPAAKEYRRIPLAEQVEVLSLLGVITLDGEKPKLHAHIVVGRSDGGARGGHLLEGHVWPTLEVVVEELPRHLQRRTDPETGLALIDLGSSARAA
jgi:predicted DNA-binding protein with PD1-like motif